MGDRYYTTSTAFLEALAEAGVRYMFANLGSDHPGLIEALARSRAQGRRAELPELIVCPHETVALSAAHAYALVTGEPQAVLVHVDSGTQNLGGAVNNASRGRAPVLIFAGSAPYTIEGELPGGRNEFIHWIQDVHDQRGILRNYVKYDNEIRTGRNVKQLVHRALQIARSEPAGPVYLVGPREVMEEQIEPYAGHPEAYTPVAPAALTAEVTAEIATALARARHPLIVTAYLGRDTAAVAELVTLCDLLAIPVIESAPSHVNFPAGHPMHCGYQWTTAEQNPLLAQADVILAVDSDVPWIHATSRPSPGAEIYCVDIDPLKSNMPLWHIPARRFAAANSRVAVGQIAAFVRGNNLADDAVVAARRAEVTAVHEAQRAARDERERPEPGVITPAYLTACVRDALAGEDALVLTEAVTNFEVVAEHLRASRPGSLIGSGGGSLGWAGGGAVGAKLAAPGKTVVCLVGDGSYLFGVPASAQWVARRYNAPALTVIYNNRGWRAPKQSVLAVHPEGAAARADDFNVSFEPAADLAGIASAAGGAHAATVSDPAELPQALKDALAAVHGGRSAVLSVQLPGA
ncbi:MAG TPA: thiamine pyrophosphate-requiring protein [Streptosporangiaceae bacterium]|nr:thiamine pyrophosphate-requiring protein [Streptosporangiaceae bacterium]